MNKDGDEAFLPLPRLSCLNTNCWSELRLLKSMFGAGRDCSAFASFGGKNQVVLLDSEKFCSWSKLWMLPKPERGEGLRGNSWRVGKDCQEHRHSS